MATTHKSAMKKCVLKRLANINGGVASVCHFCHRRLETEDDVLSKITSRASQESISMLHTERDCPRNEVSEVSGNKLASQKLEGFILTETSLSHLTTRKRGNISVCCLCGKPLKLGE